MINFKKVFSLILINIFLWQSAAFCLPDKMPVITLRPPLLTSKTFQEWRKFQNSERTVSEIISSLDSPKGRRYWDLLKDDPKAREIMTGRLKNLIEQENLPELIKAKLRELNKEGRINASDEDIESCSIFLFGHVLWLADNSPDNDIDMVIFIKGSHYPINEVWHLGSKLLPIAAVVRGEEEFNNNEVLRKNYSLLSLNTGVTIYGKDLAESSGISDWDIIKQSENLLRDGVDKYDSYAAGLREFDTFEIAQWMRYFEAYLYMYPLFEKHMPEVITSISESFLDNSDIKTYLVNFYTGKMKNLPWNSMKPGEVFDFGAYLGKKTGELKDLLGRAQSLNTKLLIDGDKGAVNLEISHFPDRELYLRILNPDIVNKSSLTIASPLESSEDLVKLILLMDLLKRNGAKEIRLVLDKSYDIKNGLDNLLRFYCDSLFYSNTKSETAPLVAIKKNKGPHLVTKVMYEHRRLESDSKEAAEAINATSERIEIVKPSDNPLSWNVNIQGNLEGENIILVHSTEHAYDFTELWVMLLALRQKGVNSISLINTYKGYSRQDHEFNPGEAVSAETMVKIEAALVDNNSGLTIHYATQSGKIHKDKDDPRAWVNNYDLVNLNAFIQPAEALFDKIAEWSGEDIVHELQDHPLVLVGPDDGASVYAREAIDVLKSYIKKKYKIDIPVSYGYLDKKRIGGTEVEVRGKLLADDGKGNVVAVTSVSNKPISDCWVLILDDETSWGTTLLAATYALVREAGVTWPRVLTGVVHGKLARGVEPFITGYSQEEIIAAVKEGGSIEPKKEYINEAKRLMPPRFFVTTKSVALPKDVPDGQKVSIGPIVSYAAKTLVGQKIPIEQLKNPSFSVEVKPVADIIEARELIRTLADGV